MAIYSDQFIYTTIHEFKSNIAKFIRILDEGEYTTVIVQRYNRPVGFFMSTHPNSRSPQKGTLARTIRRSTPKPKRAGDEDPPIFIA